MVKVLIATVLALAATSANAQGFTGDSCLAKASSSRSLCGRNNREGQIPIPGPPAVPVPPTRTPVQPQRPSWWQQPVAPSQPSWFPQQGVPIRYPQTGVAPIRYPVVGPFDVPTGAPPVAPIGSQTWFTQPNLFPQQGLPIRYPQTGVAPIRYPAFGPFDVPTGAPVAPIGYPMQYPVNYFNPNAASVPTQPQFNFQFQGLPQLTQTRGLPPNFDLFGLNLNNNPSRQQLGIRPQRRLLQTPFVQNNQQNNAGRFTLPSQPQPYPFVQSTVPQGAFPGYPVIQQAQQYPVRIPSNFPVSSGVVQAPATWPNLQFPPVTGTTAAPATPAPAAPIRYPVAGFPGYPVLGSTVGTVPRPNTGFPIGVGFPNTRLPWQGLRPASSLVTPGGWQFQPVRAGCNSAYGSCCSCDALCTTFQDCCIDYVQFCLNDGVPVRPGETVPTRPVDQTTDAPTEPAATDAPTEPAATNAPAVPSVNPTRPPTGPTRVPPVPTRVTPTRDPNATGRPEDPTDEPSPLPTTRPPVVQPTRPATPEPTRPMPATEAPTLPATDAPTRPAPAEPTRPMPATDAPTRPAPVATRPPQATSRPTEEATIPPTTPPTVPVVRPTTPTRPSGRPVANTRPSGR